MIDALYRYVPLPKPPELETTEIWYANAISDSGVIVGHCLIPNSLGHFATEAVMWIQGMPLRLAGNNNLSSAAWATSIDGRCGGSLNDSSGQVHACIFECGSEPALMDAGNSPDQGSVNFITEQQFHCEPLVGHNFFGEAVIDNVRHAVAWPGLKSAPEKLYGDYLWGSSVVAAFQADANQMYALLLLEPDGGGRQRSVVWMFGTQSRVIAVDPGYAHDVHAISMNRGLWLAGKTIAPDAAVPGGRIELAHVWQKIREDGQTVEWQRKNLHEQTGSFGLYGVANFIADNGLNESDSGSGHVVGSMANSADFSDMRGFVYRNGQVHRLDDVIANLPAGRCIVNSTAVNRYGWIVAMEQRHDEDPTISRACLLVPLEQ